jgi:hypothetical protein
MYSNFLASLSFKSEILVSSFLVQFKDWVAKLNSENYVTSGLDFGFDNDFCFKIFDGRGRALKAGFRFWSSIYSLDRTTFF